MAVQIVLNFEDSKYCRKCSQHLPLDCFRLRKKRGKIVRRSNCIDCDKKFNKAHYHKQDKQTLAARMRDYRKVRPDVIAGINKRGYQKDRQRRLERQRCIHENRRAHYIKYQHVYRQANAEKRSANHRRYRTENPILFTLIAERRRARKLGAAGTFSVSEWIAKCDYWGWQCYLCKRPLTPQTAAMEHRKPLFRGGSNWLANLAPACKRCNSSKGTKTEREYQEYLDTIAC